MASWTLHSILLIEDCCLLFVGCLIFQQYACVSQGQIYSDKFMCCHTEIELADQTFYLTQSQHTDTGLTSTSTDPIIPGAWQGSHWSANFQVTDVTQPVKIPLCKQELNLRSSVLEDALNITPRRQSAIEEIKVYTKKEKTNLCGIAFSLIWAVQMLIFNMQYNLVPIFFFF